MIQFVHANLCRNCTVACTSRYILNTLLFTRKDAKEEIHIYYTLGTYTQIK